ncbi:MAG: YedE family putative selenium transporter [Oscillospiraceae bacterium]|nr:YedE family putative selenium transporter [Oscillospiraceae bacterium]
MAEKIKMPLIGGLVAVISIALVLLGNPPNMGFCIACFLRDIAGAVGLHHAAPVQYVRPEIIGIIFGAFIFSLANKEFASKGGSAPVTRFVLGFALMIGALIFLGCPLRMALRIAGGDLNAVVGLFGFAAGILGGVFFLNKGYTLKRTYGVSKTDGFVLPAGAFILLWLLLLVPSVLFFSTEGPGSMHAPILAALIAGLIMGVIGVITRLCFVAGIRDSILFKNFSMMSAFIALIAVGIIGNLMLGGFHLGFENQPVAHTDGLWNFLGMMLVGLCAVLLGGCPFRQLILAGSGSSDSVVTVFGMIAGAAFAHNFKMASSAAGVTTNGKIGFAIAFIIVVLIAVYNTFIKRKAGESI